MKTGYVSINSNRSITELLCEYCGSHLGELIISDEGVIDDTKGWMFCPYCGRELEQNNQ